MKKLPRTFILVGIFWLVVGVLFWTGHGHIRHSAWGPDVKDRKTVAKVFCGIGGLFIALGCWGLKENVE